MTKSKKFWAAAALLSLAVMAFAGWATYGRIALHFSGDTIEVRPVPMPPPQEEETSAQVKEQMDATDNKEAREDKEEDAKAGKAPVQAPAPAKDEGGKIKAVKTLFEYKDGSAKSVAISGSFTSWKDKKMVKKNGVWKTEVYILPGTYPFHYTVDGKKKLDPAKPKAPTGDSLVTVN